MRAPLTLAAVFLVLLVGGGARFAIGLTFRPILKAGKCPKCGSTEKAPVLSAGEIQK